MADIQVQRRSVRELLGSKFTIDYYQRDYRWEKKQIIELLDDLYETFDESHDSSKERTDVENYGHYFLGQVIISKSDGINFIVDGQQRMTSLTLLLIHIYHNISDGRDTISRLIFSERYGERSFNLDVPERNACMDALFTGKEIDISRQSDAIKNIFERYQDIEEELSNRVSDETLPYFADWLIEKVVFVEITAGSEGDAYTIFETMNDRGLSLTPTEMLKGHLLSNIEDYTLRDQAGRTWKEQISSLEEIGKEEEADAIKAWLRSQHATTIRERSKGAEPRDFELIGTEFHRWVRLHEEELGISSSADFFGFIENDFNFYTEWYAYIRRASEKMEQKFDAIYYTAQNNFTLQYPILLAPLSKNDDHDSIDKKLRIVSSFLDILLARRIWNRKSITHSTMRYYAFLLMRDIRRKSVGDLVTILTKKLDDERESFDSVDAGRFRLRGRNRPMIRRILARLTDFVETSSGREMRYEEYVRYEIEHIWSTKFEEHAHEFDARGDFNDYRNRLGALLLLPKSFNASYGGSSYEDKLPHYFGQNLLAQSLNEQAYERDTGFRRFRTETQLEFRPHASFDRETLETRHRLYQAIAEHVWHPDRLRQVLDE